MWTYGDFDPLIRSCLILLAVVIAICCAPRRVALMRRTRRCFRQLAARPWRFGLVLIAVSLAINGLLTALHYPQPRVHDEFSYLLASDTFASGRLTNPPHPMWEHFESFHILSRPGYMSKYPPANALFMAAGQWMTGQAIVGVWIAFALACLALFWMLRSWTSPSWAALGALLVATNGPLIRAWGQSYWGGSVALLGGALVYGGLHRIWSAAERPRVIDAILLGSGLVLLANSRPMEGLLVSLPVIAALLIWFVKERRPSWTLKTLGIATPVIAIGLCGLAGMARYNQAVTGDMGTMPYALHDRTYSASSLLIWKTPPPVPQYNHPQMEKFYRQFGRDRQLALRSPVVYGRQLRRKLRLLWNFLPIGIGFSLIPAWFLWRDPWWRLAMAVVGGLLLVHTQLAASWIYPHYIAPALALFLALNIEGLRRLRVWRRHQRLGPVLVRTVLVLAFLKIVPTTLIWTAAPLSTPRQEIARRLADDPASRHLVIFSCGDDYPIVSDWVYNAADIDAARIVWARDMGQSKNAKLLEYYAGRKAWRCHLENDETMTLQAVRHAPCFSLISDSAKGTTAK